jgi:predicted nucleic acid-binding protein
VIDASTLVGELLRERGKARILDPRLELYIAAPIYSEMRHELLKRQRLLVRRGRLTPALATALVQEGFDAAEEALSVVPSEWLEPFREDALWRIPQDPDDWPSVALALALDAGIWTEDRDFFGCGLATWRTPVLQHALTTETL